MNRIFVFLLVLASILSVPSFAQKSTAKKEKSWQELIIGSWKLDSTVALLNGKPNQLDRPLFKELYVAFFKDGRLGFRLNAEPEARFTALTGYELLEGKDKRIIEIEERVPVLITINKVTATQLIVRIAEKSSAGQKEGLLYLSHGSFPPETFDFLAGHFSMDESKGGSHLGYQGRETLLNLYKDGKMSSNLGAAKDSGTWRVHPETFTMELDGRKGKQLFEIRKLLLESLQLHPVNTPADSVIRLKIGVNRIPEPEIAENEPNHLPLAPMPEMMVSDEELIKSWKAIKERKLDNEEGSDSVRMDIRLNLMSDSTFTYTVGKKTVKGVWKRPNYENSLILTVRKKEQIANFSTSIIVEGTEENMTIVPVLDLTFTDPTTGLVRKMLFKSVK